MRWSRRKSLSWLIGVLAASAMIVAACELRAQAPGKAEQIKLGRELFTRVWQVNDPLCPDGDGLGPMRNASSCAACHREGGVGGSGKEENNVRLLTVVRPPDPSREKRSGYQDAFRDRIDAIHPGFRRDLAVRATIVFHRQSVSDDYEAWCDQFWGVPIGLTGASRIVARRASQDREGRRGPVKNLPGRDGIAFRLSERNTPALFGAGLIDSISTDTVEAIARAQPQQFPGVSGRVPRIKMQLAKFGWRGQSLSLSEMVRASCAADLGLDAPGHHQAVNPQKPEPPPGRDLTAAQCDAITAFVASLPRPRELPVTDPQMNVLVNNGKALFQTIGCVACHQENVGNVKGIYSDLLLHDMGPGLADPVPATPGKEFVGSFVDGGPYGGTSYDVFADVTTNTYQEWRTPPLWGVADSGPYLHDGRADTIDEAVELHGGEAHHSAARYQSMTSLERERILLFLSTLRAPLPESPGQ